MTTILDAMHASNRKAPGMNKSQLEAAHALGCRIQIWHLRPGAKSSADGQWDTYVSRPTFECPEHLYQVHPDDLHLLRAGYEQRARELRAVHGACIRLLSEIVCVHQTDEQLDGEVIPRPPVMLAVTRLREQLDKLSAIVAALQEAPTEGGWIPADDVHRLTREIDVAMNGEAAAEQAALCDIASQCQAESHKRGGPILSSPAPAVANDVLYADADALIAHLDELIDDNGQGGEKWDPAQAAIAGIRAWQNGSEIAPAKAVVPPGPIAAIVSDIRHSATYDDYEQPHIEFLNSIAERLVAVVSEPAPAVVDEALVGKLRRIASALLSTLGDIDPYFSEGTTDDDIRDEEPVWWAAREANALIEALREQPASQPVPDGGGVIATMLQRVVDELREEEHERRQEDLEAGIFADTDTADQLATWANQLMLARFRLAEHPEIVPATGAAAAGDVIDNAALAQPQGREASAVPDGYYLASFKQPTFGRDVLWWMPNNRGYTIDLEQAGIYTDLHPGYHISEHTVPVPVSFIDRLRVRRVVDPGDSLNGMFHSADKLRAAIDAQSAKGDGDA